jgi:hypothetical protein
VPPPARPHGLETQPPPMPAAPTASSQEPPLRAATPGGGRRRAVLGAGAVALVLLAAGTALVAGRLTKEPRERARDGIAALHDQGNTGLTSPGRPDGAGITPGGPPAAPTMPAAAAGPVDPTAQSSGVESPKGSNDPPPPEARIPKELDRPDPPRPATAPPAPATESGPSKREWAVLDPLPAWRLVRGKWTVDGQTLSLVPDGTAGWKTQLMDRQFDTVRATVAVRRPAKSDGWAGFDYGYREWNDREWLRVHQGKLVVGHSRPGKQANVSQSRVLKTIPLDEKAAASPWAYLRIECEGDKMRLSLSSDGRKFNLAYESPAGGYRPGRIGVTVPGGDHGGEYRIIKLETRDTR